MAVFIPIISEFNSKGIDKAKKEFASLEGAGQKAQFAIKKAAVPAAAALAAVGAALFDATKGAIEDAAAQDLLANNLRKTTGATDKQIAANEDWISTQGRLLGITDDELRPVLAKLAKATGDVTKAQQFANQAMDIATATGKPLESVTTAITKAMGGNMTALAKLAPEYRTLIKDGADFETVMSLIADTTGGAATEAANTSAGQFKRLSVTLAETKESIGAALLPAIQAVLPYLTKFGEWAAKNPSLILAVGAAIATIAAAIVAVNVAMALNPFSLIIIGVVAVGAALVTAYNKFQSFRNIVDAVFEGIKFGFNALKLYFGTILTFYKTIFNGIASLWNNTIGKLSFKFPSFVPGFGGKGFDVPNIPMLADGGIVPYRPGGTLAIVGEAGPEAVIPLSKMGSMGGNNVTIHVNGGDPQAVVDALRTYMFRNGSVPIRVSG
jgi:phage-related protein